MPDQASGSSEVGRAEHMGSPNPVYGIRRVCRCKTRALVSYARLGEGALVESLERHYPVVAGTTARHTQYEFLTS